MCVYLKNWRYIMIDTHCHILWGVDDASQTKEASMDMIRVAVADGIKAIVATSHIKEGMFNNSIETLEEAFYALKEEIQKQNIPIEIYFGGENYMSHYSMHKLKEGNFATYNYGKYMLCEFAWTKNMKDDPTRFIKSVIAAGYIPVIAHPERYQVVHEDYSLIRKWREMGCLMQVNRTSIFGYDKIVKANMIANKMLEEDLIDIIASDAHRAYAPRYPKLSDVYKYVERRFGKKRAYLYFVENPKKILGI